MTPQTIDAPRGAAAVPTARRPRLLTLSCVYPNRADPSYGVFVERRVRAVSAGAEVKVIAPVPLLDYARRGAKPSAAIPALAGDGTIEVLHPRWLYPPFGGVLNALCLFLRLLLPVARLRKQWQFDVLDAHFAYPDGIAAALLAAILKVPFSITLRGNETMHAAYPFRGLLIRWSLRRAGLVIAVSERLRQFALSSGVRGDRIAVIPNGIDKEVFYPRDRVQCRRRHGLPQDRIVVLSAGALIERKGHHLAAEAVLNLHRRGAPVHLVIAGGPGREGDYSGEVRRLAAGAPDGLIRLAGAVESVSLAELMAAADVFCLASSREGWPNVVHEALACGTPVVSTGVGAVPDMLPDERYGIVLSARSAAELERGLERAIGREWDRTAIAAWGGLRSWDRVAREALDRIGGLARQSMERQRT